MNISCYYYAKLQESTSFSKDNDRMLKFTLNTPNPTMHNIASLAIVYIILPLNYAQHSPLGRNIPCQLGIRAEHHTIFIEGSYLSSPYTTANIT